MSTGGRTLPDRAPHGGRRACRPVHEGEMHVTSRSVLRQLRQLFRIVRRLDRMGVSENLILAVVFFALSRDDEGSLAGIIGETDRSGYQDDGSGYEDD